VEFSNGGRKERRYFAQLAGAGLDARAIELVHWDLKKKIGPLAYVVAGLQALRARGSPITVSGGGHTTTAELVLIGNGRLYGGHFELFPEAELADGVLEVCAFPRVNWLTLARCGPGLLISGRVPGSATKVFRAPALTLTSTERVPFEVDGELVGELPAEFSVLRNGLRLIVP
jgi:diacylglycerol kinase family enzyme